MPPRTAKAAVGSDGCGFAISVCEDDPKEDVLHLVLKCDGSEAGRKSLADAILALLYAKDVFFVSPEGAAGLALAASHEEERGLDVTFHPRFADDVEWAMRRDCGGVDPAAWAARNKTSLLVDEGFSAIIIYGRGNNPRCVMATYYAKSPSASPKAGSDGKYASLMNMRYQIFNDFGWSRPNDRDAFPDLPPDSTAEEAVDAAIDKAIDLMRRGKWRSPSQQRALNRRRSLKKKQAKKAERSH